jgi:dihydrofolate reductase
VKPTLVYSMSVSVDGFIADREGGFEWTAPSEELFGFHLAQVRELGGHLCGRRLYETMLVWETDPSLRVDEEAAAALDLGLVDELRMFRYPVVVGGGTPFLPPVTEQVPLDLIETRTFGSRVIFERYGRARDGSG